MLYVLTKALLSGAIIAAASEVAKRSPALGAVILSLPLVSVIAFVWLWRDTGDKEAIASLSQSTFWFSCQRYQCYWCFRRYCEAIFPSGLHSQPHAS
jgi:hypothetical protein